MPKPLTLSKVRPLVRNLFPENQIDFAEKEEWKLAYFDNSLAPKFAEHSWDNVLRAAQKEAFTKQTNAESNAS